MIKNLTITLLTLLILGGCSQEPTELERCIAKNVVTEYNKGNYFESNKSQCSLYESHKKKTDEMLAEYDESRYTRWLPSEGSFEDYEQRREELDFKVFEDLKKENTEFKNSCEPELREEYFSESNRRIREDQAERFCNSQGIY